MAVKLKKATYEAHIAIPRLSLVQAGNICQELKTRGIDKQDYFLRLINLPYDAQPCKIDPSTHDIDDPMIITSTFFRDYQSGVKAICDGMEVLKHYGIKGNFELEAVLENDRLLVERYSIDDFPGFTQQHGAPTYENHIVWEGTSDMLPSDSQIVECHQQMFGYSPNQIADFSLVPNLRRHDTIWRVATIYQPTHKETLAFAAIVLAHKEKFVVPKDIIAEQICVVSNPQK